MYEIEITRHFSAAHSLRDYAGDCARLHGHNYQVAVTLRATGLDEQGMAFDYKLLKAAVDELLQNYDHRCLNELEEFRELNPTSENLARLFYRSLARSINCDRVRVARVRIFESESSSCTYFED